MWNWIYGNNRKIYGLLFFIVFVASNCVATKNKIYATMSITDIAVQNPKKCVHFISSKIKNPCMPMVYIKPSMKANSISSSWVMFFTFSLDKTRADIFIANGIIQALYIEAKTPDKMRTIYKGCLFSKLGLKKCIDKNQSPKELAYINNKDSVDSFNLLVSSTRLIRNYNLKTQI